MSFEDGEEVDPHIHEYTVQNTDSKYLATAADCENAAAYYYSCSCGAKGTEPFSYGKANGHSYVSYVCTVCNETLSTSEGLTFKLNDDGESYTATGIGTCTDTELVIPSTYNNKPVTIIGEYAFEECTSLTSIKYTGTEELWNAIKKGSNWNSYTGDYTVTYNYTEE